MENDFNGDGVRDVAISDPEATVSGKAKAGAVQVVYGGGKGTLRLDQDSAGVPGAPETGDRFGFSLAVYDANLDGCSDLVIGIPYEDLTVTSPVAGTFLDAGLVQVVHGATTGLGTGPAAKEFLQGTGKPLGSGIEKDDWTGYSLAAGKTATGSPYLIIGVPGEDIGTVVDCGAMFYVHGTAQTAVIVHQDTDTAGAVSGTNEQDDRFGSSLAGTPTHFAVGSPGEALGTNAFAGGTAVFSHTLVSGSPKPLLGLGQDQDAISGVEEAGDGFGTALAMVPYRPVGATSTTESLLAVGVPGEDLVTTEDAGGVAVFRITAAGTFTQTSWIDQDSVDTEEAAEPGDFFGQQLVAVNSSPSTTSSATTTRLAVASPGEESSKEHLEKGGVQIFPLVGAVGASDRWIDPGYGIGAEVGPRMYAGLSLGASSAALYVGVPYGPAAGQAVHGFSWNVATGGAPTQTFKPGEGGLPAGGVAFGAAVR
ncbi:VCBS repeat-containing protein [Streptomyces sp. V2I9]|uniref:FG-GAP repeat domain-containing protein n=1 Tax=Streptomyces sp. V2I9 TaxID=3042304 RepID=UPI0027D906F8|nr:VCBS repeat-containing protein [Streptomyces sp. V2I9]